MKKESVLMAEAVNHLWSCLEYCDRCRHTDLTALEGLGVARKVLEENGLPVFEEDIPGPMCNNFAWNKKALPRLIDE